MTQAYRYIDGRLSRCENYGPVMRLPHPTPAQPTFHAIRGTAQTGVFALDLDREQRRSGVPRWFRPWLSRRARCSAYARLTSAQRQRESPTHALGDMRIDTLTGHTLSDGRSAVLLYLPEGDRTTDTHMRDVASELRRSQYAVEPILVRPCAPGCTCGACVYRAMVEHYDCITSRST